jgi:putative transposase
VLSVVNNEAAVADGRSMLDEICREGARTMLAVALEAEVDAYLAELAGERDKDGHALVTRNGHARPRSVQTVAGAVGISGRPASGSARRRRPTMPCRSWSMSPSGAGAGW